MNEYFLWNDINDIHKQTNDCGILSVHSYTKAIWINHKTNIASKIHGLAKKKALNRSVNNNHYDKTIL